MKLINIQMSLNPKNKSHMDLLRWLESETENKSSFIRETMVMRMTGMYSIRKVEADEVIDTSNGFDKDEILRLIQV